MSIDQGRVFVLKLSLKDPISICPKVNRYESMGMSNSNGSLVIAGKLKDK
jgi:hypothetical protein